MRRGRVLFALALGVVAGACSLRDLDYLDKPDAATGDTGVDAPPVEGGLDAQPSDGGPPVQLTVTVNGAPGTVDVYPANAPSCGAGCYQMTVGTEVTLIAIGQKSALTGWGGGCSGQSPSCSFVIQADTAVTATFAAANVIFVTSSAYTMSSIGGIAGADALCKARATAGGLTGNFIALLSSSNNGGTPTNAIDRIPSTARGWVRMDGLPVFDRPSDLFGAHQMFYPVRLDENGTPVAGNSVYATQLIFTVTATSSAGLYDGLPDCNGLTGGTSTDNVQGGSAFDSAITAFSDWQTTCNGTGHLYCLQTDYGTPVTFPVAPPGSRLAFVTRSTFNGSAGMAAFDQACSDEAQAQGFTGTFLALVGTSSQTAESRFAGSLGGPPWARPDGVLLAPSAGAFLTGGALAGPNVYADDTYDSRDPPWVWTGSPNTTDTCSDWTTSSSSLYGSAGQSPSAAAFLTFGIGWSCNSNFPVYCLQQ
jgi:hypothetical protein